MTDVRKFVFKDAQYLIIAKIFKGGHDPPVF